MRKSGSAVFLMELVVVLLFFSLSAAVTLRLFVAAYETDRMSEQVSDALERAEDAAERYRAGGRSAFLQGWTAQDQADGTCLYIREDGTYRLEVRLRILDQAAGDLETGEVRVYDRVQPAEPLCELPLARYTSHTGITGT